LCIHRFIHAIAHILNNWFSKKKIFRQNWQSIQFLSSFYYVIRVFYTLKVEHHWIESIQRTRPLHKNFIAILAWDHCKKSHINIQGYYKFLWYKFTKRYLYYYTLNWHKSFLIKFHTMKHILWFVILLLQCYWVAKPFQVWLLFSWKLHFRVWK